MNYYINTQEFARDRCLKRRMRESERESNGVKSELFCIFFYFVFFLINVWYIYSIARRN